MKPHLPYPCLTLITRLEPPDESALPAVPAVTGLSRRELAKPESVRLLLERVRAGLDGGVNVVQLREKGLPAGELWHMASNLRRVTQGRALFIVNDRVDVALAVGADGVHLPANGLPVESARELVGEDMLLGCSVHSVRRAVLAALQGADYVHVGTLYATDSKPGRAPAGPQLVRGARAKIEIPVIGVGGITARNAADVMAAGVHGVAVISALLAAPDTTAAARALREALAAHSQAQAQ